MCCDVDVVVSQFVTLRRIMHYLLAFTSLKQKKAIPLQHEQIMNILESK